jgi:hypothetical protein
MPRLFALGSAMMFICCAALGDRMTIELRDGLGRRDVELISEDADGMKVRWGTGDAIVEQALRWDQIRGVEGGGAQPQRASWLSSGEQLWRARSRLARGDLVAARTAFSAASAQLAEPSNAQARLQRLMALEGLARTSTAVPNDAARVAQALEAAALRSQFGALDAWLTGGDAFDVRSGLMLTVPPAWRDAQGAAAACASLDAAVERAREAQDSIAVALLESAARIASAEAGKPRSPAAPSKSPVPRGPLRKGAQLIDLWADALSSDEAARKRARQGLAQFERSEEGSLRLLAIYAQGRSLAMESDPEEVRRGVGKMLLIPAAHADAIPSLTDSALEQSAEALARIRDDASAAILRAARMDMQEQVQDLGSVETGDTP